MLYKLIFLLCPSVGEIFIAGVMPIMPIVKIPGHVINVPQDCRLPLEIDIIVVRKDSANQRLKQPTAWKYYYTT